MNRKSAEKLCEMLLHDAVQLPGDLGKVLIQVKRADADLVAAHVIDMIRLHLLIGFGIKKHAGYLRRGIIRAGKLRFLVLHIGEDLIQIAGMERMHVVLHLRRMGIILCVDDQHLTVLGKRDVALHDRQHIVEPIVERPRNLRRARVQLREFAAVVFQNEFLIKTAHALLVEKVHQFGRTVRIGLQQSLDHQIANRDQHPIRPIVICQITISLFIREKVIYH